MQARFLAAFATIYFIILSYAAWVMQQPSGTYTAAQHAKRISAVFIFPAIAFAVYSVFSQLGAWLDRRADAQIKRHEAKLRKSITELKDSTRFERTQEILRKYDPDAAPPPQPPNPLLQGSGGSAKKLQATTSSRAANIAATAVTGAGVKLSSALGQLWSQAAQTLIADDPTLLAALQQAQCHAAELERENIELRSMLKLPPRSASKARSGTEAVGAPGPMASDAPGAHLLTGGSADAGESLGGNGEESSDGAQHEVPSTGDAEEVPKNAEGQNARGRPRQRSAAS